METGKVTKESIGARLLRAREEATKADPSLNLTWIAAQIGVSVDTLNRYERGVTEPSYRQLFYLAGIYGKTVDWFSKHEIAA